jgi:hypothetical protein
VIFGFRADPSGARTYRSGYGTALFKGFGGRFGMPRASPGHLGASRRFDMGISSRPDGVRNVNRG